MQVTATIIVERDDEEIELNLEGYYTPGTPGKLYGPPEDCYPDEPEDAELEAVLLDGEPWEGQLTDEERKAAIEALVSAGQGYEPDVPDYDEDDRPLEPLDFDDE